MSESGPRQRPRRLTAIDMMDKQMIQDQESVESPRFGPRELLDDRKVGGGRHVGEANHGLGATPNDKIMVQSLSFNDFEAGHDTSEPVTVEVTEPGGLTLSHIVSHGSQITHRGERPNFVHPDRALLEYGYRYEHQDRKPRDQSESSDERILRFAGQGYRRDHRSPIHCWDSNISQDLSSQLLHQNRTFGNVGGLQLPDDRYQYPIRPISTEFYPCSLYPPSDLDCRAAPNSVTNDTDPILVSTGDVLHPASNYLTRCQRGSTQSSFHPHAMPESQESFCTSGPALAPYSQAQRHSRFDKLCNNYHLRGACVLGDGVCKYAHGTINEAQLKELKRIAKGIVCKYGVDCEDPLCYAGHKCPYNPCSGVTCTFPPQMHYLRPEDSWDQAVKRTERTQRSYRDYQCPRSHDDERTVLSSTVHRQTNPKERSPSTVEEGASGTPRVRERRRRSCEGIKREIDDLLEDVAPWMNTQTEPDGNVLPSRRREIVESKIDLFEAGLQVSSLQRRTDNSSGHLRGSRVTNEHARNSSEENNGRSHKGRHTDLLRYMPSRKDQSGDYGNCGEPRGRRQSNAGGSNQSHGKRRRFRIGKTDSWRPAGAKRH